MRENFRSPTNRSLVRQTNLAFRDHACIGTARPLRMHFSKNPMRNRLRLRLLLVLPTLPVFAEQDAYSRSVVARQILKTSTTSSGAPLSFPGPSGEVAGIDVTIPAGGSTGWHLHDRSGFAYVLSGTLRVKLSDSTSRTYKAGDAFAEVVGLAHEGTALGAEPVHLIAFFTADSAHPITRKIESPRK